MLVALCWVGALRGSWRSALALDGTLFRFHLTWTGLGTILLINASGLLRAETARVSLFLQPFLLVPAALGLSGFDRTARRGVLALQWTIVVVLACRISFIDL